MNILDHNFPEDQLLQLRDHRIPFQKIGRDIGQPSWDDWQEIRRFLHQLKQPTFFTRDDDFYHPTSIGTPATVSSFWTFLCCNQRIMYIVF